MHLGILTSHPIQYQAPWFRALARQVDLEVFFAHRPDAAQQGVGFGKSFNWDVDLLAGYSHQFLENKSPRPGTNHFFGCDTPEIKDIIQRNSDVRPPTSGGESARRFDAFIVVGWYLKTFWQAVLACRRAGVPVLVRGDSQLLTPRSPLKQIAKSLAYRLLLRQFDGFLVVGQRNREYLAHYGVPPEKMFFAPHFVDNEWFRERAEIARKQKAEIRRKWRIPEDAFCVLFCGKFIPKKRPLDVVAAASLLMQPNSNRELRASNSPPLHLLFVGSGELGPELRSKCNVVFDAEAGQPSVVSLVAPKSDEGGNHSSFVIRHSSLSPTPPSSFTGFLNQSELPAAYVAADVLVLPSDGGETWGLVVNEAMACGLPAIVSDAAGCAPDLIDKGRTGFTFPLGHTSHLAKRLEEFYEMWQNRKDFESALAAKMKVYSIESAVAGTLTGLKSIPSRRKSP